MFLLLVIVTVALFPTYAFLRHSLIPVKASTCVTSTPGLFVPAAANVTAISSCKLISSTLNTKVSFPVYAIMLMTIVGWVMLAFFLPTGVWAYPFDYVGSWVTRPIPMKEDEFKKAKYELARTMEILLQRGKQLIEDKKNSERSTGNKGPL